MTTLMLALIAIGIVATLAGIVYVAIRAWRLYRSIRRVQAEVDELLRILNEKQEAAVRRAEKIQTDQVVLQQRIAKLQHTLSALGVLSRELSEARTRLNPLA